jgi:hypothetical protein
MHILVKNKYYSINAVINNNLDKSESINELNKINEIVVKSYENKLSQRNKTRNKVTFYEKICYLNEQNNKQVVLIWILTQLKTTIDPIIQQIVNTFSFGFNLF